MVRTKPLLYEYQERRGTLWRPTVVVNRGPGHEIDIRYKGEDKLCVTCGSTRVPLLVLIRSGYCKSLYVLYLICKRLYFRVLNLGVPYAFDAVK